MAGATTMRFRTDNPGNAPVKARFWFVAAGLGMVLLGLIASLDLAVATLAATMALGALMLMGSVLQLAHAFAVRRWSSSLLWLLGGLLYLAAGLSVLADPGFAAMLLTLFLAVSLGLSGALRCALAWGWRAPGKGWLMISGVVSLVAAVLVGAGWPLNTVWVLGLVLAVDLLMQGLTLTLAGLSFPSR